MVSQRFLEAFARGELTKGGLAEAGWFDVGTMGDDGIVLVRDIPTDDDVPSP